MPSHDESPSPSPLPLPLHDPLRVVTLNLWGESAPLERRLALAFEQLAELSPDVVALQEVRVVPGKVTNTAETLASALGMRHVYEKTVAWGGGDEGLALLSAHPILSSGHRELPHATESERRIVLWAVLDVEGTQVAAFSTHLNYRMTHGREREAQVAAVDEAVRGVLAPAESDPAARPAFGVVMGDFNAAPACDEIRFLRGEHTLDGRRVYYQDAYLCQPGGRSGELGPGLTWSRKNPATGKLRFLEFDRRIDYVFVTQASRDGRGLVRSCRVVLDRADEAGIYPSDHFGVYAEIERNPLPTARIP